MGDRDPETGVAASKESVPMMTSKKLGLCVALLLLGACSRETSQKQAATEGAEGAQPKEATPKDEETGRKLIQNKGSDTLVNVAQAWAESYKEVNPKVAIAVSGGGSGTGFSALLNGTAELVNSSRKIKDKEIQSAKAKGIDPKEFLVGHDALAIFLHTNNPVKKFTVAQLKDIFGDGGKLDKWSQLGVKVPGCDSDEIVRVSRQNNSGTYAYFREAVLGEGGEFKLGSRDMHGSKDVVDLVMKTPCAIGYSGVAYLVPEVAMPCIEEGDKCVVPSEETALDGSYPISRPLFMYTPGEPQGAVKEYLDWILSDKGQCIIADKGYAPVRAVKCD